MPEPTKEVVHNPVVQQAPSKGGVQGQPMQAPVPVASGVTPSVGTDAAVTKDTGGASDLVTSSRTGEEKRGSATVIVRRSLDGGQHVVRGTAC